MSDFLDEIADCVPALRRYARALTRDADVADDLVQDCIERAIRKRRLWLGTGSLQGWLFKILLNIYRNDLRGRSRRAPLVSIDEMTVEPGAPPEHGHRLALSETAAALSRLPEEQKQALLLVAVEGFSYAEAAKILDVPQGTLMSRLSRARANLRSLIEQGAPVRHLRPVR